jgi:hypothetical protein
MATQPEVMAVRLSSPFCSRRSAYGTCRAVIPASRDRTGRSARRLWREVISGRTRRFGRERERPFVDPAGRPPFVTVTVQPMALAGVLAGLRH